MTKKQTPPPAGTERPAAAGPRLVSDALPARKPMARATRITLFEREVRVRLSGAALDVLFARAELLSEGQRGGGQGQGHGQGQSRGNDGYFGSTMLTIDLPSMSDVLRDECDAGTAHRLVALMEDDSNLPRRIREIAVREATRIATTRLKDVRTHVTMRAQGAKVFIDVDVEAGL